MTVDDRPAILALDQATSSGWAIWTPSGGVTRAGLARSAPERRQAVFEALAAANSGGKRLLVVYEDHAEIPAARGWGAATLVGLGKSIGRWLEHLELAGHPDAWIMKVGANEWRDKLIGRGHSTAEAKRLACSRASLTLRRRVLEHEHDLAEAVCIAEWASFDGLARFMGKRDERRLRDRARASKPAALPCALCGVATPAEGVVEVSCRRGRLVWHPDCADLDAEVRALPWTEKVAIVKSRGKGRVGKCAT